MPVSRATDDPATERARARMRPVRSSAPARLGPPTRRARAGALTASLLLALAILLPLELARLGPAPAARAQGPARAGSATLAPRASYTNPTPTIGASPTPVATATLGATVTPTRAPTGTPTISATLTRPTTVTVAPGTTATVTAAASRTVTATASPTMPTLATPSPSATATRTGPPVEPSPATPTRIAQPVPIYLPYLARSASLAAARPRVWGTQFLMEWDPARHADNVLLELPRARRAGIGSIRTDLRWMDVEPSNVDPEAFDWQVGDRRLGDYSAAGMDLLVSLIAYPRWATEWSCGGGLKPGMEDEWRQFVRAAAERYGRPPYHVTAWEIGNEVDGTLDIDDLDRARPPEWGRGEPTTPHGGCWAGRAAAYVDFLRAAREEILAVDPSARVTHGGLAYVDPYDRPPEVQAERAPDFDIHFLDDFLLAGGCEAVDFFGYHWFLDYPWQPPGDERHARLRDTLRRYGCAKPVWLTETFRLSTPDEPDDREWQQVEFLTREIFALLAQPDLERIYWYGWVDFPAGVGGQHTDAQRGLIGRDRRPKLGLQVLPQTIAHGNGIPEDLSTDRVAAYRFRWPRAGRQHLVAWSKTGRAEAWRLPAPAAARTGVTARIFDRASLEAGRCCTEIALTPRRGWIDLELGQAPVFLEIGR